MNIKTGDKVIVIKGKERGKTGVITAVDRIGNRVKIEGLNMIKRHLRKGARKAGSGGGIVESAGSINAANVMLLDPATSKPTRVSYNMVSDKKTRVTKKSNTALEDAKK